MDRLERAWSNAGIDRIEAGAESVLDRFIQRYIQRARWHKSFGNVDNAGKSGKHDHTIQLHELELKPSGVLSAGDSIAGAMIKTYLFPRAWETASINFWPLKSRPMIF